jgi:hypothetical protein
MESEETAVAREQPIKEFPLQRTHDVAMEELLEMLFSIEPTRRLYSEYELHNENVRELRPRGAVKESPASEDSSR